MGETTALQNAKAILGPHVFTQARLARDGRVTVMRPVVPATVAALWLSAALAMIPAPPETASEERDDG